MKKRVLFVMVMIMALLMSGCEQEQLSATGSPEPAVEVSEESPEPEAQSTEEEEDPIQTEILPSDPQTIEFQAADGATLVGTYYPSAVDNAPLVIMMHWARGDQSDWIPYALWMQNRMPTPEALGFEALPAEISFAVFTFDFRGFGQSPGQGTPENWLMDAMAAVETARTLPGVDPARAANIGASIGADGAADACDEACLGALSISPGDYLNVAYAERVTAIMPRPVRCITSQNDQPSASTCSNAGPGENFEPIMLDGGAHGMDLIDDRPTFDWEGFFLEFLEEAFGILL